MAETRRGLIHVYTGDGKGKTTAALGMALRAAGHGLRTYVCQFMKGQTYGELAAVRRLGADASGRALVTIEPFGQPTFVRDGKVAPEDLRLAQEALAHARRAILSGAYDIVVLDEINVALYFKLLTVEAVLELIDRKPAETELVLTGRRVPDEIVARADYVTVMQEVKHPYQQGIQARKGIEF